MNLLRYSCTCTSAPEYFYIFYHVSNAVHVVSVYLLVCQCTTAVCINCSRTQVPKVSPDGNSARLDAADATNIIIFPGMPEPKIQYLEKYSKPGKSGLSQAQPVVRGRSACVPTSTILVCVSDFGWPL